MKVNDEDFHRWFDEAGSILSGVGERAASDAQRAQAFVAGLSGADGDSRASFSDITTLIRAVDASRLMLVALWNDCQLLDEGDSASDGAGNAEIYQKLSQRFLMLCNAQIRTLARDVQPAGSPEWSELLARTMWLTRLCARWYWLRYERPPATLWTSAAYLFELWESAQNAGPDETEVSIHKNYIGLLFIQWIAPSSLSSVAYFLVEDLVDRSLAKVELVIGHSPKDHEIVDLDTGEIVLTRDVSNIRRKSRLRYFPLAALREHVAGAIAKMDSSQTVCMVRDAIEQLSRTVIGHQARHLVRFGNRTPIVRTVHLCQGYAQVIDSFANSGSGSYPATKAFVRDRSINGCRLFVDGIDLKIGMLVTVDGVFPNERSLGIVRWLSRASASGWNAGIWLLRGSISRFDARLEDGMWPSGNAVAPILLIDEEQDTHDGVLAALPKDVSKRLYRQLLVDECRLRLHVNAHVESGRYFDLVRFYVEEIA